MDYSQIATAQAAEADRKFKTDINAKLEAIMAKLDALVDAQNLETGTKAMKAFEKKIKPIMAEMMKPGELLSKDKE